jgi:hypothetical protein
VHRDAAHVLTLFLGLRADAQLAAQSGRDPEDVKAELTAKVADASAAARQAQDAQREHASREAGLQREHQQADKCAHRAAIRGGTCAAPLKSFAWRRGVAWHGVAWRGVAWRGVACVAWRGVAWRGVVWLLLIVLATGAFRQGIDRH